MSPSWFLSDLYRHAQAHGPADRLILAEALVISILAEARPALGLRILGPLLALFIRSVRRAVYGREISE